MSSNNFEFTSRRSMPVLPLRGLSVFPGMLLNFDVERPMSAAALNFAMNADQILFLAAQKEISEDVPFVDDIYKIGTVCRVRQMLQDRACHGGGPRARAHRRRYHGYAEPLRRD